MFPTQPKPITSFPAFQITITCTTLHFFPNQFKENFRSVEQERGIEAVGKAYLCYMFTYFIQFLLYYRRPNGRQERWHLLPSLILVNSRTEFSSPVLKFSLQLILLHMMLLIYRHLCEYHNGVNTNLEPDILEWEVKWVLGIITTNKASGGDGIPVELFQILKDDAVKVLYAICQ